MFIPGEQWVSEPVSRAPPSFFSGGIRLCRRLSYLFGRNSKEKAVIFQGYCRDTKKGKTGQMLVDEEGKA